MKEKILIVEPDKKSGRILGKFLSEKGYEVKTVSTGKSALNWSRKNPVDVCILAFDLPDDSGLDIIQKLKILSPRSQIILTAEYANVKLAVKALKRGAFNYITHPLHPDEMLESVEDAIEKVVEEETKIAAARKRIKKNDPSRFVYGESAQAQSLKKQVELVAPTDLTVIITGETGTGKEFVAREIKNKSKRKNKPFVALDCGAIPEQLAGSELFGHVKGAFTGAVTDKEGCFERANGGTLFLDEVGNLSYENQVQLLRVLQERKIQRVGDVKTIPVDVRILVATNDDLKEKVQSGEFREDLFHRLNEFSIQLAPLRDRKADIEIFAQHFLSIANRKIGKDLNGFETKSMEKLKSYYWHGNLRELNNLIKRAVLLSQDNLIKAESLPREIMSDLKDIEAEKDTIVPLSEVTAMAETEAIKKALRSTGNNKTKTAELLGIDRSTLYNKMEEYNIKL